MYIGISLLFPYVATMFLNGMDLVVLNRKVEPEALLPLVLETQISAKYEAETLAAQAVIARSNLYRKVREGNEYLFFKELQQSIKTKKEFWKETDKKYEKAAEETKGQVLTYEGELRPVPYHEISSGKTRDGEEAFHDSQFAYLESVDSSADKESTEYLTSTYIAEQQLPEQLKIAERDKSGYVISLKADENILEAETFVLGMGIASSDFSIQRMTGQVRFLSRGKGHGLGFSQYGGNELAKEGKNWQEILYTYFPLMEISLIDAVNLKEN
ncbi:SpoIID/LytB domain-containing protein [Blautia sp. MSJ-19]|uniref:SpoIID/LytB domain-containing protein n=1 Tax=Blautia sp. MSJ-19 TaxID=2841517 RepID=UPI0020A08A2B|nr:SpoIID/LytB domain-containing protein [Blautia sp. MSJ-19]